MLTQNLPEFWENLYIEHKDYWNLGKATPALLDFFNNPLCPQTGSVLVPGAGFGYDAEAWAKRGHEVLAVDFGPSAVDELDRISRRLENFKSLDLDLFELNPKNPKKGGQQFDIVYDYCTFTGIHPGRRDECFEVWQKMLKDDGVVIAFFYPFLNGNTLQGPPHPTSGGELMARLGGIFEVVERVAVNDSIPARKGKEEIWILKKAAE